MPRRKARRRSPKEVHTRLAIRVDGYETRVEAAINRYAHEPRYTWGDTEDEPLYHFLPHLDITGTSTYPDDRAGAVYELTIYGEDSPNSRIHWKLQDIQAVDEHRVPKYREYRGKSIPVYVPPKGMGTLDRVPGEARWRGAIFVPPRFISDLLIVLGNGRTLFMAIEERKIQRQHWIQGVCVQTTDPAKEE